MFYPRPARRQQVASGEGTFERRAGRAPARGHSRGRCRGIQPADGPGRGRHSGAAPSASPRTDRSENRRAQGPHRQDHRRRHAGRVPERRGSVPARSRCSGRWPSATPATPEDQRIVFRIGINLGDIIVEDDDIFGDGVNVAARLEALAEPGGICISALCTTRSAASSISPSRIWASRRSRTSPGRCGSTASLGRRKREARRQPSPPPCPARQAVDRRPAVPEHERRPGAGIFRRWHGRGDHHRAVAHPLAVRDRPQFELHLQGPSGRCEAGRPRAWASAMCSKARCAKAAVGCASPPS